MSAIEYHRKLLGDSVRNQAFYEALKKVVVPGKTTVADIGAGTGLLSFLASKLGAKECFLYECGDILQVAKDLAEKNNIHNCHFVRKHSEKVRQPVQADIIVCETLGNFAYEEHIIENMEDARRFLKVGGVRIPQRIEQYVAPITSPRLFQEVSAWEGVGFGLNFKPAEALSLNNMYVRTVEPSELLPKSVQRWDTMDFCLKNRSIRRGKVEWKAEKSCSMYGFAAWWKCELFSGISLSTSPHASPTHWEQNYLPILEPFSVRPDDVITLVVTSDTRRSVGVSVQWVVSVRRGSGKHGVMTQSLDMRKGFIA